MKSLHVLIIAAMCVPACSVGRSGTQTPERRGPSEAEERPQPGGASSSVSGAASGGRDRDPEAEKRKMAESRARSGHAVKMLRSGRYAEAVASSKAALKIHEQNVEAMLVMAEVFYRQGKYELVHAVTSSALAVDEKIRTPAETSKAYNLKGFAYAGMSERGSATQAFRKAAESDENNAAAWNNLGTRYLESGDIDTALSCFTYALKLQPRFAKAHLNHGAALRAKGNWLEAEKAFNTALQLRPNYPEAYFNLGLLYLDAPSYPGLDTQQRLKRAIGFFERYKGSSSTPTARRSLRAEDEVVSPARADDYIRVADKGLEREKRRVEREQKRQGDGASSSTPTPAGRGTPTPASPSASPGDPGRVDSPRRVSPEPSRPGEASPRAPQKPVQKPSQSQPPKVQAPSHSALDRGGDRRARTTLGSVLGGSSRGTSEALSLSDSKSSLRAGRAHLQTLDRSRHAPREQVENGDKAS